MVFNQYWAILWKEMSVSEGEHSLASKCKSEVLPLQYQDNGESILPIPKKWYDLELFSSACFIATTGF